MATAFHEPMTRAGVEFDRLNDAERRVLRLLAEGHTAKSIANAIGSTAPAVNERLREARRKTGIGSSRELARLLKAQEKSDDQIELGRRTTLLQSVSQEAAEPWRPNMGVLAMIALFLVAAASAAALMSQGPATSGATDPLIGEVPSTADDPARLYARIRAEQRDSSWAPATEHALNVQYSRIAQVGAPVESLRIRCAATLCEVAGLIDAPADPTAAPSVKTPLNRTMQALQGKALHDEAGKIGLENLSTYFGGGKPGRMVFLQYWQRKQPDSMSVPTLR